MTRSGIIRKVDELGRIVIPIEIRKYINIQQGEILEFNVDDNSIVLTKRSILDNNTDLIKNIATSLDSVIDGNYIITDRKKVIYSSESTYKQKLINDEMMSFFKMTEEYVEVNNDLVINRKLFLFPYVIDGTICGFIILYDVNDINKYIKLMKFINVYISARTCVS